MTFNVYLGPKGQCPSKVDQRVRGDVKLQRKKSETAKATMKELRGSILNFGVVRITTNRIVLRMEPKMTMGKYRPKSKW